MKADENGADGPSPVDEEISREKAEVPLNSPAGLSDRPASFDFHAAEPIQPAAGCTDDEHSHSTLSLHLLFDKFCPEEAGKLCEVDIQTALMTSSAEKSFDLEFNQPPLSPTLVSSGCSIDPQRIATNPLPSNSFVFQQQHTNLLVDGICLRQSEVAAPTQLTNANQSESHLERDKSVNNFDQQAANLDCVIFVNEEPHSSGSPMDTSTQNAFGIPIAEMAELTTNLPTALSIGEITKHSACTQMMDRQPFAAPAEHSQPVLEVKPAADHERETDLVEEGDFDSVDQTAIWEQQNPLGVHQKGPSKSSMNGRMHGMPTLNCFFSPYSHYHNAVVKRTHRHVSGDNFVAPCANGSLRVGSDRELSYELSKELLLKRWSLSGAGPELALLRAKLEDVQRELDDLQCKHDCKLNECQALLRQLNFSQDSKSRLDNDLQAAYAEIARLKFDNERLMQHKCSSERQMLECQTQMQRAQRELDQVLLGQSNADDLARRLSAECDEWRLDREATRRALCDAELQCTELRRALAYEKRAQTQAMERTQMEASAATDRVRLEATAAVERAQAASSSAFQQFQRAAQERDLMRANVDLMQQEFEESLTNGVRMQNALQLREDELQVLKVKHKRLSAEYNQVMEERNKVLEENERLSDETGRQVLLEKNRKLEIQVKYLQEREEFYRKQICVGDQTGVLDPHSRCYYDGIQETPDLTLKNKENLEIEGLQLKVDQLQLQLDSLNEQYESSRQELETAKQMREWALVERQRIVAERDTIRAMCDDLRRDRDNAVTKLAVAFSDTEELQRYKEQADRELKKMRERLELDLKSTAPTNSDSPCSPSNSRDSAIDTDMAEWEIETLTINVGGGHRNDEIGLELRGGRDDPMFGMSMPVYVKSIERKSKFDGILKVYDCIIQVNNIEVTNMERRSVIDILKNSNSGIMVIRRRRLIGMKLISISLEPSDEDQDFGVLFENGIYVTKIKTSSVAAKCGSLAVGDRLVYINDIPVQGKTACEVDQIVHSLKGSSIVLAVIKSPPVLSPMTPSISLFSSNSNSTTPGNQKLASTGANISGNLRCDFSNNFSYYTEQLSVDSVGKACKDESVQVKLEKIRSTKKESLLDKMHDKIFGKTDRKSAAKAHSIMPDKGTKNCAMASPATVSVVNADRWRVHPHYGGSERAGRQSHRPPSLYSAFPPLQPTPKGSPEQQVLQQLDSILEASEKHVENKCLIKIGENEATVGQPLNYSGGTWPKLRAAATSTFCQPPAMGNFVVDEVTPLPVIAPIRRGKERRMLPIVFGHSGNQPPLPFCSSGRMSDEERNSNFHNLSIIQNNPLDSHAERQWGMSRATEPIGRPISYHPTLVGSNLSHFEQRNNSGPACGRHQPFKFDQQIRQQTVEDYQSNRRTKVMSQYDPVYANLSSGDCPSISRRHIPPFFAKNVQHINAPPRYKPQLFNNQNFSSVPSSAMSACTTANSITNNANNSSLDHDIDTQSVTSQSSGFSRSGTKNYFYHSTVSKNSSVGKIDASGLYKTYTSDEYSAPQNRLSQGDVRTIVLEKRNSHEVLGINVTSLGNGVFVSSVSENSLAAKHGIQVGDQLLEICGINMRSADMYYATNVLRKIPQQDINLVVQYNPERYYAATPSNGTKYRANPPTAASSRLTPSSVVSGSFDKSREFFLQSQATHRSHDLISNADSCNSLQNQPQRLVYVTKENSDWGFKLIGGNAIGIFVDNLKIGSPAYCHDGLRNGDQVLEFDGLNFRKLTLEQALFEFNQRPCDSEAAIKVQFNEHKYQRCKAGACDSFYIRTNVERKGENNDQLNYKVGDVLRVDNTYFNENSELWRAWLVDQEGRERFCGIIPSKSKLEEESSAAGCDANSEGGGSRRGTLRRSWKFIRRSSRGGGANSLATATNHQRTSSKESRDMGAIADQTSVLHSLHDEPYQRVERVDYKRKRPLLILGALTDLFVAKLLEDYPKDFAQCVPECVQPELIRKLESGLQNNVYVDYRKRDKLFEVTSVAAVIDIIDKDFHCILHVSVGSLERLRHLNIYPVVIFVKFKNAKQIKEISDDRISSKQAKEIFEAASRIEIEHYGLFSCEFFSYCEFGMHAMPCFK